MGCWFTFEDVIKCSILVVNFQTNVSDAQKWFGGMLDLKDFLYTKMNTSYFKDDTWVATNTLSYFHNLTSLLTEYMSDSAKTRLVS